MIMLKGWKEEVNPTNETKAKKLEMEKETGRKVCQKKKWNKIKHMQNWSIISTKMMRKS